MALEADPTIFPNNIVNLVAEHAPLLGDPGEINVFKRPLRSSDPVKSVGVNATLWTPDANSYEMGRGRPGYGGPTLQRYTVQVQGLILDMDEVRGLATHAMLAKLLREMLVRDTTFHLSWAALAATGDGTTERVKRRWIPNQEYYSNDVNGSFIYLTTLDFITETETV